MAYQTSKIKVGALKAGDVIESPEDVSCSKLVLIDEISKQPGGTTSSATVSLICGGQSFDIDIEDSVFQPVGVYFQSLSNNEWLVRLGDIEAAGRTKREALNNSYHLTEMSWEEGGFDVNEQSVTSPAFCLKPGDVINSPDYDIYDGIVLVDRVDIVNEDDQAGSQVRLTCGDHEFLIDHYNVSKRIDVEFKPQPGGDWLVKVGQIEATGKTKHQAIFSAQCDISAAELLRGTTDHDSVDYEELSAQLSGNGKSMLGPSF